MSSDSGDSRLAPEHYIDQLRRMACARFQPYLRGRFDPSDLVQQTLLIAHERRSQFHGETPAQFLGWLRAILDRTLLTAARRFSRFRPESAWSLEGVQNHSSMCPAAWLIGDDTTPSQHADRNDQILRLAAAMASLPESQRTALELHYFQDLSVADVAARMDRSIPAVAGLLFRGGRALRHTFD